MGYTKVKKDNYAEITQQFIDSLELILKGELEIPSWVRPWSSIGQPANAFTGRAYKGMNTILLSFKAAALGYADNRWATYNQISKEGGQVNKGEKGTRVILWRFIKDKKNEGKTIPLLRTFTVFNVNAQSTLELPSIAIPNKDERDERIEEAIKATGAVINHGGDRACYSPTADEIRMPLFESFLSSDDYAATMFHELGHWTGAKSRLNRDLSGRFGDESYAFEELVAELCSSFVCQSLGVDGKFDTNNLAYIKSWVKVLKNDSKAIFKASSLANNAAKFILGDLVEETEKETEEQAA
jgi:antirestriction protein ArdC